MIFRLVLVLILSAALAGWRLYRVELAPDTRDVSPETIAEAVTTVPRSTAPQPPDLSNFTAMVQRPLFRDDRRPAAPDPPAPISGPVAEAAHSPEWVLIGIGENADGRVALLRLPGQPELIRARVGDRIDGRTVQVIERDSVRLTSGASGEELVLTLE